MVLHKSAKRSDGSFPICIRVINNRQTTFVNLGYNALEEQWNSKQGVVKSNYPNSVRMNNFLRKELARAQELFIIADTQEKIMDPIAFKKALKRTYNSSFKEVAEDFLSELFQMNKFSQYYGNKPRIKIFMEYIGKDDIPFQQIDIAFLKRFSIYLSNELNLSQRTINNYLIMIRTLFNRAIRENLVEHKFYPFGKGKIQIKEEETVKIGLNEFEVKLLEQADFDLYPALHHARNIWLVSFYLAGVRFSDVVKLKWTEIVDGRLNYTMGKNKKVVTLKIPIRAMQIIHSYKNASNSTYVFPYLQGYETVSSERLFSLVRNFNSTINKQLNKIRKKLGIEKKLSMHIARHTFGNIASDKIHPLALQKLYRHTDIKTTMGYQSNFIHKDVDGALSDVLNF
ncbi:MAG: phage integrase SAM-like domain-containing protein [Bacteroidia bacterium]